jgi:hypothetical protein
MLFDLQSRRRRNVVRVVYGFLALLMIGGLILVGVGTGNGNGGLLNAFTNNGSGNSSSNSAYAKQLKAALADTKKNPTSPAAWQSLMQARLVQAQSGSNYRSSTGVYSASGKAALQQGITAWNKYLMLTSNKPASTAALLANRLYAGLGDYSGQASAWQYVIGTEPSASAGGAYTCLAYTAYAAGDKTLGDLAASKAVAAASKLDKLDLKASFKSARKTASTAKEYVASNNC